MFTGGEVGSYRGLDGCEVPLSIRTTRVLAWRPGGGWSQVHDRDSIDDAEALLEYQAATRMSGTTSGARWLPTTFCRPAGVEVGASHHLRHIRGADAEIDHAAVMGSRERLWRRYGQRFGWPRAAMTLEEDRLDLERHLREADLNESFNYALLDHEETAVLGCVYIDPPAADDRDAEVSWWVVDELVGSPLEARLNEVVPRWIGAAWPFRRPLLDPAVG